MTTAYPTALDTYTAKVDGPGNTIEAAHINALQDAIAAIEAKLGIGASTAVANAILVGLGAGSSGWATTLAGLTLTSPIVSGAAAVTAGQHGFDATNKSVLVGDGATIQSVDVGAWRTWVPTLAQNGARTLTVNYGAYRVSGRTVQLQAQVTCTDAGTAGNAIILGNLPVSSKRTGTRAIIGSAYVEDSGTKVYVGAAIAATATTIRVVVNDAVDVLGVNPSFALANGDVISVCCCFEI